MQFPVRYLINLFETDTNVHLISNASIWKLRNICFPHWNRASIQMWRFVSLKGRRLQTSVHCILYYIQLFLLKPVYNVFVGLVQFAFINFSYIVTETVLLVKHARILPGANRYYAIGYRSIERTVKLMRFECTPFFFVLSIMSPFF